MKSLAKNIPEDATNEKWCTECVANHLLRALVARQPPRRRQFASGASPLIDFLQLSLVVSRAAQTARPLPGDVTVLFALSLFSHQIFVIERAPRPGNSARFHDVRKYATRRDSPLSLCFFPSELFIASYHPVPSRNHADGRFLPTVRISRR